MSDINKIIIELPCNWFYVKYLFYGKTRVLPSNHELKNHYEFKKWTRNEHEFKKFLIF